ncbi:MAG: ThuA domain-containing protein [Planctomycetaceae bacterium]|nr:ThuA domain-containing protein [Planctomycetaceae bacterium]
MHHWLVRFFLVGLICGGFFLTESEQSVAADKVKILMVTQSAGFVHGSVKRPENTLAPAEIAMKQLAQQTGEFEVDCTQDCASDFTKENLQNYDIVMFYTTGNLPIAEADLEYFFNEWLPAKGHGVIGVHSTADTFHEYKPFWDMIGGTFNGHPWNANGTVTMAIHDPGNPMMKPFGEELVIQDEIYQYKNWQPEKVRVLMSINMAKSKVKRPYHVPVAWIKDYGEGRVYFNNLGHREETWANTNFLDSLLTGIKWVSGQIEADATPNPELSKAQEEQAKKDTEAAEQ